MEKKAGILENINTWKNHLPLVLIRIYYLLD